MYCNGTNYNGYGVWNDATAWVNRTNPKDGNGKATEQQLTDERLAKMWGLN